VAGFVSAEKSAKRMPFSEGGSVRWKVRIFDQKKVKNLCLDRAETQIPVAGNGRLVPVSGHARLVWRAESVKLPRSFSQKEVRTGQENACLELRCLHLYPSKFRPNCIQPFGTRRGFGNAV
jgi:hypothetical protein